MRANTNRPGHPARKPTATSTGPQAHPRQPSSRSTVACAVWMAVGSAALAVAVPQQALAQASAQQPQGARQNYNIPAGPLAPALRNLAISANLLLTFTADQTDGKTTAGISGQYTAQEALTALLGRSGLQAVRLDNGGYVLRAAPAAAPVAVATAAVAAPVKPDAMLPAVKVTASSDAGGTAQEGYRVHDSSVATLVDVPVVETPYTVQSVPSELARNQGATRLADVLKNATGVQVNQLGPGRPDYNTTIRGFPTNNFGNYRDGIRVSGFGDFPVEAYERVDVMVGPAGLQSGFASVGGMINYVTKRPGSSRFTRLDLDVDQHGGHRVAVDANLTNLDAQNRFGLRAVLAYEDQRNYIRDYEGDRSTALLSGRWRLTDATTIDADFLWYQQRPTVQGTVYYNNEPAQLPNLDPRNLLGQPWAREDTRAHNTSLAVRQHLAEGWDATFRIAQEEFRRIGNFFSISDPDPATGIADSALYVDTLAQRNLNRTWEAALNGSFATGAIQHELVLKLSRSHVRYCLDDCNDGRGNRSYYEITDGSYATIDIHNPVRVGPPDLSLYTPEPARADFGYYTKSEPSLVAVDRLRLSPEWDVWAGVKRVKIDEPAYRLDGSLRERSVQSATLPLGAVVYRPTPALNLYSSFARGLEQGGTAPDNARNAGQPMPPARTSQVEIGAKWEVGSALYTLAIFEIERAREYVDSGSTYVQDGRQKHRGVQVGVSGRVTPALTLHGGLLWMRARSADLGDPAIDGKIPEGVAEKAANVYAEYRLPFEGLVLTGSLRYEGPKPLFATNGIFLPSFTTFNLGLRWEGNALGRRSSLRLMVDNATDKRYLQTDGYGGIAAGAPRVVKLGFSTEF